MIYFHDLKHGGGGKKTLINLGLPKPEVERKERDRMGGEGREGEGGKRKGKDGKGEGKGWEGRKERCESRRDKWVEEKGKYGK